MKTVISYKCEIFVVFVKQNFKKSLQYVNQLCAPKQGIDFTKKKIV